MALAPRSSCRKGATISSCLYRPRIAVCWSVSSWRLWQLVS